MGDIINKKDPRFTGIVHLWDLPEEKVCLSLDKDYAIKLLNIARNFVDGKWNKLAKVLGLKIPKDKSSTAIRQMRRTNIVGLYVIKKLSKFLVSKGCEEYNLEEIEKKLILIKSRGGPAKPIYYPKFPINFNTKEGAIIISSMFHDGGISVRDLEPFYSNNSDILKERFHNAVKNLVGNIDIISKKKCYKELNYPKILGLILITLGLIPGKRPINNPKFPEFVFNYSEDLICEFLSQSIADDGWVYCPKKSFGYVGFNFTVDLTKFPEEFRQKIRNEKIIGYIPNVLIGNKKLFEQLGLLVEGVYFSNEKRYFKDGKEKRYTQEWQMCIRDPRSLNFLSKKLEIPLTYNQEKLVEIANRERVVKRFHPKLLKIILEFGGIATCRDVEKKAGKSRMLRYRLNNLCKDGFLKRINFKGKNRARYSFLLTEKGKKELELLN